MLRKTALFLLILCFISGGWCSRLAPPALTAVLGPGDLDPTFGSNGKVTTNLPAPLGSAVLQSDGKILAAGFDQTNPCFVVRYKSDGTPDPTFGSANGKQTTPFTVSPNAMAVQSDGKIIVAGRGEVNLQHSLAVFRLNPDGSTDTTFGSGGLVITNFSEESRADDLAVLADGKILVAGEVFIDNSFLLIRLNTNGTLDASFGTGGIARPKMGPSAIGAAAAHAIAIQPDLKIVAVGFAEQSWAIARFHPNGQLDEDFSNDGKILLNFDVGTEKASDVVLQSDGKIVVAGFRAGTFGPNTVVVRLNSDGTPDVTFGSGANGVVQPVQGVNRATSVVMEASGKILIAGSTTVLSPSDFILMRLSTDGSIDTSFGTSGIVLTDFGGSDDATKLMLQPDGKVVAAGSTNAGFALARYLTVLAAEPVLQVESGSNHAIAVDSVTFERDPFSVVNDFVLNPDQRTRIILFVGNLTLESGEDASAVTVQAEDSGGVRNLQVEFVGKVPGFDSLTQVVVKLPDGLANGNVQLSVSYHGKTSNKGLIVIE
ncbi:MAG TPA: hypothetical protein VFR51_15110 [Pyrinomonadaceae bacterium]|nr:hypothetical protein [Pyrinomonadaceae bacterium]